MNDISDKKPVAISVIIPVFNSQKALDRCLAAMSQQCYPYENFEVIVVDNNSSPPIKIPSSLKILVKLAFCQKAGSYAARNVGWKCASGEVVAFTDADCVPDQNWLKNGITQLTESDFVGGEVEMMLSAQPSPTERYQYITGFMQKQNIEGAGFSVTANMITRKPQLDMVGGFNEDLMSGGDREWCWRARKAGLHIRYAKDSVIKTEPRTSFWSAVTQTRRTTGGRYALKKNDGALFQESELAPHRSALSSLWWLLTYPNLSILTRISVVFVAILLKFVQVLENMRLKLGGAPERR